MIAFFPEAYHDELLYSLLSRYHQRSGNARFVFTAEELYRNGKITHPSIDFVNVFTDDAMKWLTKEKPWEIAAEEHTMFPALIRFLPLQRRREAEEGVRKQNGNWKNIMCLPVLEEKRYLRFCSLCAKEDREKYGETYWHREHQIPRIRVCPRHRLYLGNSTIPIHSKTTPGLFDAESTVPENAVYRLCENEIEIEFTQYVLDVFGQPVDTQTDFSISAFLHSKLKPEYKNESGIIRNMKRLYEDYTNFYDGMPTMTQTYVQKIFNGYMYDVYYILQIAFFMGVSVYDIAHIPSQSKECDELYLRLAEKHNLDYSVVADIAEEVLKQKAPKVSNLSGPRRRDYEKLDEELLPKVKAVVDEIVGKEGKPERVSPTKIQRLMGLPQKQFNKLPKCRMYIESKAETQEEYHKRKVDWAVAEIERRGGIVTVSKVMKLTNMRKGEIEKTLVIQLSALSYLCQKTAQTWK